MTIMGKGHVLVPQDRGGRRISWDGDCKGKCGEEENKRSWFMASAVLPIASARLCEEWGVSCAEGG